MYKGPFDKDKGRGELNVGELGSAVEQKRGEWGEMGTTVIEQQ